MAIQTAVRDHWQYSNGSCNMPPYSPVIQHTVTSPNDKDENLALEGQNLPYMVVSRSISIPPWQWQNPNFNTSDTVPFRSIRQSQVTGPSVLSGNRSMSWVTRVSVEKVNCDIKSGTRKIACFGSKMTKFHSQSPTGLKGSNWVKYGPNYYLIR